MKIKLGDVIKTYSLEDLQKLFKKVEIVNDFVYCYKEDNQDMESSIECHKGLLDKTMIVFSMNYRDYEEPVVTEISNINQVTQYFGHRMNGRENIKCDWFSAYNIDRFVKSYIKNIFEDLNL